ncbi:MAG: PepSY domain-containing protein [Candidatus Eremiobacteraeota bacterium]|nr:PepSY domain-containing protein [Candidatus Eremiobacteraeota bacterium]
MKLHRWLGLGCGLVFFVVCLSGSILLFEDGLSNFLDRSLIRETNRPVSLDLLRASAETQLREGEWIQRIYLPPGKVRVRGTEEMRHLYFSPEDATYLGEGNGFTRSVIKFHRSLFLSDFGRWITLTSCLFVITTLLSGVKLWMPNKWKRLGSALTIKRTGSRRRFLLDLHRVLGIFVVLPLLLIASTGLNYSMISDSLRQALFTTLGEEPMPAPRAVEPSENAPLPLDRLVELAVDVYPEAELSCVELSKSPEESVKVRFRHPGQPGEFGQSNVMLHPRTGEVLRSLNAMELPAGQQFVYVWALPLHRGEAFGLLQTSLWFLVVLIGAGLPLTGAWLWYSKRPRDKKNDLS